MGTQLLKRLIVCSLLVCLQIFSFFPLSSFSFYTVQYRRVQYSTVIGQLPRVSTEDRVVSVFEPSVGQLPRVSTEDRVVSVFEPFDCSLIDCKFSNFFLFHPSLFIQYSTEECSTVQYKAKLGVYWPAPSSIHRGIEWSQCLKRLFFV